MSLRSKMADASTSWSLEEFNCAICLDLLKDPVALTCGHSYCMSCITGYWDQDDQKGVYSCPQCRQTFTPRPVLGKNTMLAEVLEKLKKTKLQAVHPDQCYAGSGDVECDVCTGDKNKAIKSCLVCLNSYCQNHLEQHETFFRGKGHNLMDATGQLQEMICPQHEKLLEIFCCTDQQCICYLCTMDKHKNHETVSAAAERTEKQRQLGEMQSKNQLRIQERQKVLEKLREAVESHKRSAQAAVEDSERIFTELIRSIERSRSEVTQLIRDQENAAVSRAEGQLEQLEQEIEDLRRRDAELEQLSHTDNHIHFLQSFQSLSVPPESTDSPKITVSSRLSFDDIGKSVSHLREKLENFCREEIEKISGRVTYIVIIPTSEPKTREEFLQYSHQLTLDLNTVNKNLCLSEENRVIEYTREEQPYPDHPDRFDHWSQVLCRESVCGRCYWEVEWSGWVYISVSYKSINRKRRGKKSEFGCNDQSWCLFCSDSRCSFWHNNEGTELPVVSSSSRIGVYVDHGAGTLSFYSVSDTMTLIHRVHTTFTQPLYAGFEFSSLCKSVTKVKLCKL
ncbi:tripartite motif-containing protein 16-like protein [Sinocyclocheilus rhinocerous]|nr:PREDICTED: tripartite motif-containing protein 16-like protein [Sinocyclocheilus rhinocerous]